MSSVPFDASSRRSSVDYQNTAILIYSLSVKLLTKIKTEIKIWSAFTKPGTFSSALPVNQKKLDGMIGHQSIA